MGDRTYTIKDMQGRAYTVVVRRDKRLKKSARWQHEADDTILLRIPFRLPKRNIAGLLEDITRHLDRRHKRAAGRTDADLQARAEHINAAYFEGKIEWAAIRWVGNMRQRLGSCTNGGSTDGHIRISESIKSWPQWVIDYVIAHELAHRMHANHSPDFWNFLTDHFPDVDRARGFIDGMGFAQGIVFEED